MERKFTIYDNEVLIGVVNYHKDLLPKGYDPDKVAGGGMWDSLPEKKEITFFGQSFDFGPFDREALKRGDYKFSELWQKKLDGWEIRVLDN